MIEEDPKIAVVIPNSVWCYRGGALMRWIENNFPDERYQICFTRRNGKLIPGSPIRVKFITVEAATLCKLIWNDHVGD